MLGTLQHNRGSIESRCCILLALAIFVLFGCLLQSCAGSTYYSPSQEPRVTVTKPRVIQSGRAGTNTFYMNNTSAKVDVATPGTPTYYPGGYGISAGTHVSGTASKCQVLDKNKIDNGGVT